MSREGTELVCSFTKGLELPYTVVLQGEDEEGLFEYDAKGDYLLDCLCKVFEFDPKRLVMNRAFPVIEHLSARKSKTDNGFEVEARIYGRTMGGLRIARIDMPCLIGALGQYIETAWAAAKVDAEVTDFHMTVERGVNGHGRSK